MFAHTRQVSLAAFIVRVHSAKSACQVISKGEPAALPCYLASSNAVRKLDVYLELSTCSKQSRHRARPRFSFRCEVLCDFALVQATATGAQLPVTADSGISDAVWEGDLLSNVRGQSLDEYYLWMFKLYSSCFRGQTELGGWKAALQLPCRSFHLHPDLE